MKTRSDFCFLIGKTSNHMMIPNVTSIRKKRTKTRERLHHLPSVAAVFLTLGTSNRVVVLCELFDRALHDLLGRHLRKEIALFLHFFQTIKWRKKRRFDEQKKRL